jgi:hypothetical protein
LNQLCLLTVIGALIPNGGPARRRFRWFCGFGFFMKILPDSFPKQAHNVLSMMYVQVYIDPAVYGGLAAQRRALQSKDQGWQNVRSEPCE